MPTCGDSGGVTLTGQPCGIPTAAGQRCRRHGGGGEANGWWLRWKMYIFPAIIAIGLAAREAGVGKLTEMLIERAYQEQEVAAIDMCIGNILGARVGPLPDPFIPRPKLRDEIGTLVGLPGGNYAVVVGPRGSGKSILAVDAAQNRSGIVKVIITADRPSMHGEILGEFCPRYMREVGTPGEKHLKDVLQQTADRHHRKHGTQWVPTLIIEVDRGANSSIVSNTAQVAKRVCNDLPRVCRAILVMSDALAGFALPRDPARQRVTWVDDFTAQEAAEYLDARGFMNETTPERTARTAAVAKIGTRPADLERMVDIVSTNMTLQHFVEKEIADARGVLEALLIDYQNPTDPWTGLVRLLLQSSENAVALVNLNNTLTSLKSVRSVAPKIKEEHAIIYHLPTRAYRFYSPAYCHAAKEWERAHPPLSPTPPLTDRDTVVISLLRETDVTPTRLRFSRRSEAAAIKEAILLRLRLSVGTQFELIDSDGVGVTVDGNLPPGEYTVVVIDQRPPQGAEPHNLDKSL